VVGHVRKIAGFSGRVFVTKHGRRQMYEAWHVLQKLAQIKPDTKLRYGFHDLRGAFATENAELPSVHALQMLMQHKSIATTQGYINMGKKMKPAAHNLFVPDLASASA
jgi:integrase